MEMLTTDYISFPYTLFVMVYNLQTTVLIYCRYKPTVMKLIRLQTPSEIIIIIIIIILD